MKNINILILIDQISDLTHDASSHSMLITTNTTNNQLYDGDYTLNEGNEEI